MEIPPTVVTDLIRLGGGEIDASLEQELATRLGPFDWVDRLTWQSWDMVTAQLPQDELASLARGLVRAEKIKRWGGGSVAGAIWVFRAFQLRFPGEADELAQWMLAHSDNPWAPFGSDRGSARSIEQLREHQGAKAERQQRTASNEAARAELKAVKETVRERVAVYRRRVQRASSEARAELVRELESLPASARLEHLAWDEQHPLGFYPASLVAGSEDAWIKAAAETRCALLTRAAAIPRGEWRQWWKGKTVEEAFQQNTFSPIKGFEQS